ncbi:hypothetical protein EGW08_018411 [Elysia chlorotica]|uniref:G-protein coupled receptors family 1 profile domain-containing protein n=1 Tax=Elysia chlorotica TaxID=188477 RepID=A0A433SX56_ELYCH|nr:hypothetical protein EGW08_018411 [Elysia chlorotica]
MTMFFSTMFQLVTGMFIYPSICLPGLLCNALSVYVLTRRNMLTSTNAFLSALAVADSIKLLNDVLYFLVIVFMHTSPRLGNLSYGYLYPYSHFVFNMSLCVSAWLTVSVAMERYILVCHPTKARAVWSRRRAVTLCTAISIGMTCLALPFAFRYRTIRCVGRDSQQWRLEVELTEMWQNKTFVMIYTWIQNLMRSIIPLIVLIILNTCIVWALRKTRVKRRKTARHRVTVMMIVVILTFLVCITPDAILSTVFGFGYHEAGYLVKGIREITDTLLAVNAGVNFLIYCAFNKVFRRSCARLCCARVPQASWMTEMDESTYRRLSEAKSVLLSNNNSPPRPGMRGVCHSATASPALGGSFSPLSTSRATRRGQQPGSAHERRQCERGVGFYLPTDLEDETPRGDTPSYSEDEEDESKSLIQRQDGSCKSYSVSSGSASNINLPKPDFLTVGHLISASLSLPSLPQLLQDVKTNHPVGSDSEFSVKYKRNNSLKGHYKSVSHPLLPLPHDKYEIPLCPCSSQSNIQRRFWSSLGQIHSLLKTRDRVEPVPTHSATIPTDYPDLSDHSQQKDRKPNARARHRHSSNGLKKSRNSVKSKRAKRRASFVASVCSDSECGLSEGSFSTEIYDHGPKESCLRHSTEELPCSQLKTDHFRTGKKIRRLKFVPPCLEGIQDKNMDTIEGYKDLGSGLTPDGNLTNLKQCVLILFSHS